MYSTVQIIMVSSLLMLYKRGKGDSVAVSKGPIDFSKLELNKKALLGSRWSIEHPVAVTVYHAFQIVDMVKVDLNEMSIRVDFFMRQRWDASDDLKFPDGLFKDGDPNDTFIATEEDVLKSVWSPDSFVHNARDTKILSLTTLQSAVNIYKNKTIIYKTRMYAILGCSFTFQWYPLDIQVCSLILESYKYSVSQVVYEWEPVEPVTALENILLYQYDFFLPPMLGSGKHDRWGVTYPNVNMTFKFERKLGNNIIQVFTPTILVVILSFFSFWLGLDAVPGRISLLVTCILTLVTMHSSLKGVVPPVHYIKMMDIWMIGCMVFVFGAICEFIIVKYLLWRSQQMQTAKEEQVKYLKKNGLLPAQQRFPANITQQVSQHNLDMGRMVNLPNSVYPEFGQYQSVLQNRKHYSEHQPISNSAQKRRAWNEANAKAIGIHTEYNIQRHGVPHSDYPGVINMNELSIYNQQLFMPQKPPTPRKIWVTIDRVCRVLFPLLFAIFNAAYWPILLIGSAKQHEDVTQGFEEKYSY